MEFIEVLLYLFFFLIAYSYLIYPVAVWAYSSIVSDQFSNIGEDKERLYPNISIVISAYNEESVIQEKLENCITLDYPRDRLEIIFASDGSTDSTNRIIEEYASERIKFISLPRMGKVNVLNEVIPITNGEIIVFSDANTIYNKDALIELVKHFDNKQIGCVCGNLKLINPNTHEVDGESIYWKYEKWIKKSESKLGIVVGANGAIYAIRKHLVDTLPTNTINDDFHISMGNFTKGFSVIFSERAIGSEYIAKDFTSEFKRHIRDGAGHYREMRYYSSLLNPIRGKYFFSYFSHRVLRWLVPFFMIGIFLLNVMLAHNYYYLLLLYGQVAFYLASFIIFILKSYNINVGILNIVLFFVSTNIALFIGFMKNIFGLQSVKWDSTER